MTTLKGGIATEMLNTSLQLIHGAKPLGLSEMVNIYLKVRYLM